MRSPSDGHQAATLHTCSDQPVAASAAAGTASIVAAAGPSGGRTAAASCYSSHAAASERMAYQTLVGHSDCSQRLIS